MTTQKYPELKKFALHYKKNLERLDDPVKIVDWGSKESQIKRFEVIAQIGDLHGKKILDVGCGLCGFYEYLKERDIKVNYTGIDICPEMIEYSREKYPEITLKCTNILEEKINEKFDYVISSGIFNRKMQNFEEYFLSMVKTMFSLCNIGIAFNMLSKYAKVELAEDTLVHSPEEIFSKLINISSKISLRHDYLPHDFTIYLYK